jgi:RimJ/RimL family protein N-acetyltransferase
VPPAGKDGSEREAAGVLDPCGDFSWVGKIDLPVGSYIGAELPPELVHRQCGCADETHRFLVLDLTRDPLPAADLLLCRDCWFTSPTPISDWHWTTCLGAGFRIFSPRPFPSAKRTRRSRVSAYGERRPDGEGHRMDQNESFMAQLGGVRDEGGTRIYLERNLAHWNDHGVGIWMLRDRETGAVIGRAVLRHLDVEGVDEVEMGYGFLPKHWGRGLATEVARACVHLGMTLLGSQSLVGITLPSNGASQRVMLKAGLVYQREIVHEGLLHVLFRTRDGRPLLSR